MPTKPKLTQTLKLFKPEHTTVIFCHNPKLSQTLYYDLLIAANINEKSQWREFTPTSVNDMLNEMKKCLSTGNNQDHENKPQWFLLNLEKVSRHYENMTHALEFVELLFTIDEFAQANHLRIVVTFATFSLDADAEVPLFRGWADSLATQQRQQHLTFMAITDKEPITLTIEVNDNASKTVNYAINDNGHLIEQ